MIFTNLSEKCEYYRSLTDYRLSQNEPIMVMIDGKNFSKLIKNRFEKPFDDWFISAMNKTAEHLCKNIQNCIGAFVQSDEISLIIKNSSMTSSPFDGRICKLQSIIPAMATAFFNRELMRRHIEMEDAGNPEYVASESMKQYLDKMPDYVFDCKVWNVPNDNDAMAWIIYRQIDCIRNSKQQFCQTYLSHKELMKLNTDEQCALCLERTGNDWNSISDDKKYGRILYKELVEFRTDDGDPYFRSKWITSSGMLTDKNYRTEIIGKLFKCE